MSLRSEIRAGPVIGIARALLVEHPPSRSAALHSLRAAHNADATRANFGSTLNVGRTGGQAKISASVRRLAFRACRDFSGRGKWAVASRETRARLRDSP